MMLEGDKLVPIKLRDLSHGTRCCIGKGKSCCLQDKIKWALLSFVSPFYLNRFKNKKANNWQQFLLSNYKIENT
jgi:hypothetical protein